METYKDKTIKRLLSKGKKNENGCLEWLSSSDDWGYGVTSYTPLTGRSIWKVHRLMYFLTFGEIPNNFYICHKCDNPKCFNIDHLFLGSPKDNAQDRLIKGREGFRKGTFNGRSKLNEKDIPEIRNLYKKGLTGKKISEIFNVSHVLIYKIINYKLWNHVED